MKREYKRIPANVTGGAFIILGLILVLIEWVVTKDTIHSAYKTHQKDGYILYSFIHDVIGYKFFFPLLGLIVIAVAVLLLSPLITKHKERP